MHFARPAQPVRPGDVVTVEITYAAPHHLLAERPALPRSAAPGPATPGSGAHAAAAAEPAGVMLGLPTVGVPSAAPAPAGGCGCD